MYCWRSAPPVPDAISEPKYEWSVSEMKQRCGFFLIKEPSLAVNHIISNVIGFGPYPDDI